MFSDNLARIFLLSYFLPSYCLQFLYLWNRGFKGVLYQILPFSSWVIVVLLEERTLQELPMTASPLLEVDLWISSLPPFRFLRILATLLADLLAVRQMTVSSAEKRLAVSSIISPRLKSCSPDLKLESCSSLAWPALSSEETLKQKHYLYSPKIKHGCSLKHFE